jgi:hypothetical protein
VFSELSGNFFRADKSRSKPAARWNIAATRFLAVERYLQQTASDDHNSEEANGEMMKPHKLNYQSPPPKKHILRDVISLIVLSSVKLIAFVVASFTAFYIMRWVRSH